VNSKPAHAKPACAAPGGALTNVIGFPPDMRLYIQGKFTYEDIFGKSHESRFCYWYAAQDEFPMCSDHNYMNQAKLSRLG
jgi:hypothetical protein